LVNIILKKWQFNRNNLPQKCFKFISQSLFCIMYYFVNRYLDF
jgi:hypothetical protein